MIMVTTYATMTANDDEMRMTTNDENNIEHFDYKA